MALLRGLGLEANAANDSATLPTYTDCRLHHNWCITFLLLASGVNIEHIVVALLRERGLVADVTSPGAGGAGVTTINDTSEIYLLL